MERAVKEYRLLVLSKEIDQALAAHNLRRVAQLRATRYRLLLAHVD